MTCLGVLDREERGDDNETGLKQEGGIKMSTTVLPLRDARSLRYKILTLIDGRTAVSVMYVCSTND
jgi:hypothetical protein